MESKVQTCINKLSIKRDNVFSKMMHSKFDASHAAKIANLCQILYGDLPIVAPTILEAEEQMFRDLVYLWYNNHSVIEELYHLFKLSGLCFLHGIHLSFGEEEENESIQIIKHLGKSKIKLRQFDPVVYMKTEIRNCQEKFMAIPITFKFNGAKAFHANILFIKVEGRNKNEKRIVEMERFEPHGSTYVNESLSYRINSKMHSLGNSLFPSQHYDVKQLVKPIDHCPTIKGLQNLTAGSAYEGSCTIFAMLYAILKSINPERTQSEIADDIYKILLKHNNPTMIVRLIVNVLTGMLNITKEGSHYYIVSHTGEKRELTTNQETIVNAWINDVGTNVVMHRGNKYEGKFEDGQFVEGTITFAETNSAGRKTYTGKINKETIQLNDPEGELIWKDGKRYKGSFIDGKMTGKGIFIHSDGEIYEGDFLNDLYHGKGDYRSQDGETYVGDWINNRKHGKGIYHFEDGNVYDGDWIEDEMSGKGKYYYKSGNVYDGDWIEDEMSGKGKYYYKSGNVYEGDFDKDYIWGKGTMRYVDGRIYEGDWKKDKITGKGLMRYANGDVYEGDWLNNKITGKGIMRFSNGNSYEGYWKDDLMDGKGKYTKANGEVLEGDFVKGIYKMTSPAAKNTTRKSRRSRSPKAEKANDSSESSNSSKSSKSRNSRKALKVEKANDSSESSKSNDSSK